MSGAGGAGSAGPGTSGPGAGQGAAREVPPDLRESLRQVGVAGRASASAFSDASKAFRSLFATDISLARSALGRTMAFAGLAIAFGASAWLLLMATLIALLRVQFGLDWTVAMLGCAVLSMIVAGLSAWMASRYFEHTRLKATRRQLARLGLGELADFTPAADSPQSAKDATENAPLTASDGGPIRDKRGVPVTPP